MQTGVSGECKEIEEKLKTRSFNCSCMEKKKLRDVNWIFIKISRMRIVTGLAFLWQTFSITVSSCVRAGEIEIRFQWSRKIEPTWRLLPAKKYAWSYTEDIYSIKCLSCEKINWERFFYHPFHLLPNTSHLNKQLLMRVWKSFVLFLGRRQNGWNSNGHSKVRSSWSLLRYD